MLLPTNERCRQVVKALGEDVTTELTEFETDFVESNQGRQEFTDKQKMVVQQLMDKYTI